MTEGYRKRLARTINAALRGANLKSEICRHEWWQERNLGGGVICRRCGKTAFSRRAMDGG